MKKTIETIIKKISKVDPLGAGYLKRHIKYDLTSGGVVYTGNKSVITRILSAVKINK